MNHVGISGQDASGNQEAIKSTSGAAHAHLPSAIAGEDQTNDVLKTEPGENYIESVAASQTGQVLGTTGATGDYLEHIMIVPSTTAPGAVALLDGATSRTIYTGGTVGADLTPIYIPIRARSLNGAWSVTTNANESCICVGRFT